MISYEGSKWYVKMWRKRWYFIIPLIFIKENVFKINYIDNFFDGASSKDRKLLINSWFDIKKHIELTKLNKYS